MNPRELEIFNALMIHGTTARTAEIVNLSQPAVSKAIQSLERSCGFALFQRQNGRLRATAEGRIFHREVAETFSGLAHLKSVAQRLREFGSGQLSIACLSAFSNNIAPDALGALQRKFGAISVTLQVHTSSIIRDLVAQGRVDVGIVGDEVNPEGLDWERFVEVPAAVALPPGHPLAAKARLVPLDLDGQTMVALSPQDTTQQETDRIFERFGVSTRRVVETPFSTTVCALVLAGLGIGIVDPVTAPGFVERGLVLRRLDPAPTFRTLLIFPVGQTKSILTEAFVDRMREAGVQHLRAASRMLDV